MTRLGTIILRVTWIAAAAQVVVFAVLGLLCRALGGAGGSELILDGYLALYWPGLESIRAVVPEWAGLRGGAPQGFLALGLAMILYGACLGILVAIVVALRERRSS